MSGGGGKGGSQTSETQIPQWVEDASRQNLARADEISQIGYTPYYGPDVAAFSPMQQAAFQNTGQAANAFGMAGGGMTGMEGMPQAQDFGGGLLGYSSQPIYQNSLDTFAQQRPGQFQAMNNLFMDPMTGAPQAGAQPQQAQPQMSFAARHLANISGGGGSGNSNGVSGGGNAGGYIGFGDMFDGGGAGASGSTFQGGPYSGALNTVGVQPRQPGGGSSSGMGGGK